MKLIFKFLLFLLLLMSCKMASSQVKVIQFNAEWNKANNVSWCNSKNLSDCKVYYIDIAKSPDKQKKYNVVVVPTIVVFKDGEEIKRYQANLSFKITATKNDIQELVDESIMSGF
jgi:thiol-disulfide isomerase/thioredoxin